MRPPEAEHANLQGLRAAAVAGLIALVLYLLTLADDPSGDSLEFAWAIEQPLARFAETHQLLVLPLAWLWVAAARALHLPGEPVVWLQALNAVAGAICVALVGRTAEALGAGPRAAFAVAMGFALSYGTWALSTQAEFATPGLALALAALLAMVGATAEDLRSRSYALVLGVGVAVATLLYQTNVFLLPVGIAAYLCGPEPERRARLRAAVVFAAAAVLTATAVYAFALYEAFDVRSWQALAERPLRPGAGTVFGVLTWTNLPHGAYALVRSLVGYTGVGIRESTADFLAGAGRVDRAAFGALYALGAAAIAAPMAAAWRARGRLLADRRREGCVLATWAVLFGAFGVYWVPGDLAFWLPVLAAWWLLVALVAGLERGRWWEHPA